MAVWSSLPGGLGPYLLSGRGGFVQTSPMWWPEEQAHQLSRWWLSEVMFLSCGKK